MFSIQKLISQVDFFPGKDIILWKKISSHKDVDIGFLSNHFTCVDWDAFFSSRKITKEIMEYLYLNVPYNFWCKNIIDSVFCGYKKTNEEADTIIRFILKNIPVYTEIIDEKFFDEVLFINRYIDVLNFDFLLSHNSLHLLSEDIIENTNHKINWYILWEKKKFSESYIRKNIDKADWYNISRFQVLSERFMEDFCDQLNWSILSAHQIMSEKFIEKYKDRVNWLKISHYQVLSEKFIEKFKDRISWVLISEHQILSEKFIHKFRDKVDWEYICLSQKLSTEFKILHKINVEKDEFYLYDTTEKEYIDFVLGKEY